MQGYLGCLPDSKAVLDSKYIAARDYQLVAYPLAPGPAKVLQRSNDPYGYMQLSISSPTFSGRASPRAAKRAVFAQNGKLMLGEGEGTPVKWPSHSDFHWWDDEHVVTVTDAGLVMMDLQGQVRVLDPAATDIVHH